MKKKLFVITLSIVLLSWPKTAAAACSTFGGRATVVQANVAGMLPVVLADTGNLDSTGGAKQASLLSASVPGLLTAGVLHATAIGLGSSSQSEASLANLNLTVAGITIRADFAMARANAYCGGVGATVSGKTHMDALVVNGLSIIVTGSPNQTISLLGGAQIIINEQTSSVQGQNGSITVNALHVTVPGAADVVVGSAFALVGGGGGFGVMTETFPVKNRPYLVIGGGGCQDFVTGGGWVIAPSNDKGTFGVGGGIKHGQFWGHLEYQDHGTGDNVHGTGVTNCTFDSMTPTLRHIEGTADLNGQSGDQCGPFTYTVDVADNGEPGGGVDTFAITVSDGCTVVYTAGEPAASTTLGDGNIQLHD